MNKKVWKKQFKRFKRKLIKNLKAYWGLSLILGVLLISSQILDYVVPTPTITPQSFTNQSASKTASPIATKPSIVPTTIKSEVIALESKRPEPVQLLRSTSGNCEQWRALVSRFDWNADIVLLVMKNESGCNPNNISTNKNGSHDYGLMQLNNIQILDPAANIEYAYYHKYVSARRGAYNFSAWYAVCTPAQVPLFNGVKCA